MLRRRRPPIKRMRRGAFAKTPWLGNCGDMIPIAILLSERPLGMRQPPAGPSCRTTATSRLRPTPIGRNRRVVVMGRRSGSGPRTGRDSTATCAQSSRPTPLARGGISQCGGNINRRVCWAANRDGETYYPQVSRYLRQLPAPCSPNSSLCWQAHRNCSHPLPRCRYPSRCRYSSRGRYSPRSRSPSMRTPPGPNSIC